MSEEEKIYLWIFKVHPDEDYVDGMALVKTTTFEKADDILRDQCPFIRYNEVILPKLQPITPELKAQRQSYIWYLDRKIEVVPSVPWSEYVGGAQHDG